MKINWTYASKALISLAGTAYTLLVQYPHVTWQQIVTGMLTASLVWLVPNTTKSATITTPVAVSNPVTIATALTDREELERLRAQ